MYCFSKLPKDIINYILLYYGQIKYKDGKYINIISIFDERYKLLYTLNIPNPVQYTMLNDCYLREHFEYKVELNDQYNMCTWNIYDPPNKIQYFFYKKNEGNNSNIWYRL